MELTILGCHSATPRANTHTTSQLVKMQQHQFLVDCGEATQIRLRQHKAKLFSINHIFISHLHGDHFYGLIGLVSSYRLMGRTTDLHIYGPKGIKEIILLQLKLANSWTDYGLYFHELESKESVCVFEDEKIKVSTLPLDHRVYTNGFLFEEKPGLRKVNREAVAALDLPPAAFKTLQQGKDLQLPSGKQIANSSLTFDPAPPFKYAFCSDTAYHEPLVELLQGVDVLYHEATFLEQHRDLAAKTKHSTALQAAKIAKAAQVGTLILGHYSTRYKEKQAFVDEAQTVFPNVVLAEDGKHFSYG